MYRIDILGFAQIGLVIMLPLWCFLKSEMRPDELQLLVNPKKGKCYLPVAPVATPMLVLLFNSQTKGDTQQVAAWRLVAQASTPASTRHQDPDDSELLQSDTILVRMTHSEYPTRQSEISHKADIIYIPQL